jgi:hypothetical protein
MQLAARQIKSPSSARFLTSPLLSTSFLALLCLTLLYFAIPVCEYFALGRIDWCAGRMIGSYGRLYVQSEC